MTTSNPTSTPELRFIPAQRHPFPDGIAVWSKRGRYTYLVVIDGPGWQSCHENIGGTPMPWHPGDLIAPVADQWVPVPEHIDPEQLIGERMRWEDVEGGVHEVTVEKVVADRVYGARLPVHVRGVRISPETLARLSDPDAEIAVAVREASLHASGADALKALREAGWNVVRREVSR